jgi:hypothetical protein
VDHLDVVTRAGLANPITARFTKRFSSSSLEDGLNCGPGGRRTTGHERRTVTGTLLSSRNARTNEQEALLLKLLGPSDRVGIMGVTTINDDITLLEMGSELLDERINGRTGLDKEDNFTWPLELGNKLFDGVSALDVGACKSVFQIMRGKQSQRKEPTFGLVSKEIINLGCSSVVGNDGEALVVDVQNEVLALLKEGFYGENLCDIEVRNLTMTAKPMRPISPLGIDNGGEQGLEGYGEMQRHTLVRTYSTMSFVS